MNSSGKGMLQRKQSAGKRFVKEVNLERALKTQETSITEKAQKELDEGYQ